jgi:hypothetical protein
VGYNNPLFRIGSKRFENLGWNAKFSFGIAAKADFFWRWLLRSFAFLVDLF